MRLIPFEVGEFEKAELAMLMRANSVVMIRAILPGIESTGIAKVAQETTTNRPEGR